MSDSALSGVNVLDLSDGVSGGYCTKIMSDLGAQVIKVEPPVTGDSARSAGPFLNDIPNIETSAPYLYLNTGKKSITLDLKNDASKPIVHKLVKQADILIENFKPGVMSELGLDYDILKQLNPGLIMASISYFGQTGPYRDYEGSELIAYAVSGYMYLTGDEDREPLIAGGSQSGYQAGLATVMAVMAALSHRDFTAEGQYIDVSTIEALAGTFDGVAVYTMLEKRGTMPRRAGTRLITRDPHSPYPSALLPCKDGWVHVHYSPSFPEGLALLTGNPRLEEPEVLTAMMGHADEIDQLLMERLKDHTREEIQTQAQELRIPFTMVQSIAEVLDDPQNEATGFFVELDHPVAGKLRYPSLPYHMPESPWQPVRAPLLGEHNRQVYCDVLRYSEKELTVFQESGVI